MSVSPPTRAAATTSSTSAAATAAIPTNATILYPQTFWCHECDMSILLLLQQPFSPTNTTTTTSPPPLCPHCHHDFLEEMDSLPTHPTPRRSSPPTFYPLEEEEEPTEIFPSDDNFLPDNPYLRRLLHHLTTSNPTPPPRFNSPASNYAVESLTHIVVDSAFLENDPSIVCPVCKDQFVVGCEAKMLPCNHTYHSDCIVPWLEMNNSCPVCRYRLPSECDEMRRNDLIQAPGRGRESFVGAEGLDELLDDEQDLIGIRSTLRNVVRRHLYSISNDSNNGNASVEEYDRNGLNSRRIDWDNRALSSSTRIGEDEGLRGTTWYHVERANSVETMSSWPVEGSASGSRNGDGESGVDASSGEGSNKGGCCVKS